MTPASPALPELVDDASLLARIDFLLDGTSRRPLLYHNALRTLFAEDAVIKTGIGRQELAERLSAAPGVGADAQLQIAVGVSKMCRRPDFMPWFLDQLLSKAEGDLDRLRQIHAAATAFTLQVRMRNYCGGNPTRAFLVDRAAEVMTRIQAGLGVQVGPTADAGPPPDRPVSGRYVLLVACVPEIRDHGAHLKQLCSYSEALLLAARKRGIEAPAVRVIFTYENATSGLLQNFQWSNSEMRATIDQAFATALAGKPGSVETLHLLPSEITPLAEWARRIRDAVDDFRPDGLLRWFGFHCTQMPAPLVFARYPTIGLQFNANNDIDGFADLLLSHGRPDAERLAQDPRWRAHRIPMAIPERRRSLDRAELGVDDSAQILASVLSNGRLETAVLRLGPKRRAELWAWMRANPAVVWFWIGVANPAGMRAEDPELASLIDEGRIRCLHFFDDLRAFYRHCALYVHLPAMAGGGMGVAMALAEDCPVLLYDGTDPANFIEPSTIVADWESFAASLRQAVADPVYRRDLARRQAAWMTDQHGLLASGEEVLDYMADAVGLFRQRAAAGRDGAR